MWIETEVDGFDNSGYRNSFASNGECGLKQPKPLEVQRLFHNSFASNGECGLKQQPPATSRDLWRIHSPAMANVD